MTAKKRGLSRGLEALLNADSIKLEKDSGSESMNPQALAHVNELQKTKPMTYDPVAGIQQKKSMQGTKDNASAMIDAADSQSALVLALFEHIRKENLMLLEEAEALKRLIEEFELIIGRI